MSRTPAQKRSSERVGNTNSHEGRGAGKSTTPGGREKHAYFTAFFTSAAILASSGAVNPFSAKALGHMAPSSRFALSLKPSVAYLVLNFCAAWKKQTTLPSLAYAGIPYQSLGERTGALSLMIPWSRLPMVRSGSRIPAIFASTAPSPSALSPLSSWMRSLIAPCSSSVNPLNFPPTAAVPLVDFCVPFRAGFMKLFSSSEINYFFTSSFLAFQSASLGPWCRNCSQPSEPAFSMGFESFSIRAPPSCTEFPERLLATPSERLDRDTRE